MQTLGALYSTYDEARRVMDELNRAGFSRDDVSIIANDASGKYSGTVEVRKEEAVTSGQGAGFGAVVGAGVGIAAGLGALIIPGIGPVIAAGSLLAALTGGAIGAVAGGATGGIVGALVKTNKITREDAEIFAEGIRRGNALVLLNAPDDAVDRGQVIMSQEDALDIRLLADQWRSAGWNSFESQTYTAEDAFNPGAKDILPASTATDTTVTHETAVHAPVVPVDPGDPGADRVAARAVSEIDLTANENLADTRPMAVMGQSVEATPTVTDRNTTDEIVLPIVEEHMQVSKREVQTGKIRIYSHVQELPTEAQVTLRDERISVERQAVDRPVADTDAVFQDQTIELTETEERAVVTKTARVVEEVVIRKDVDQRNEVVHDTVRRTEVQVEQLNEAEVSRNVDDSAVFRKADIEATAANSINANMMDSAAFTDTADVNVNIISTDDQDAAIGAYDKYSAQFQDAHREQFGTIGTYESFQPYYRYGFDVATNPRYAERDWSTAETDIRTDWELNNPGGDWNAVRDPINFAWETVRARGIR